jgi:hypothetical protein
MCKKNCGDCLYCKVSAFSTKHLRLCYCSETEKKEKRIEFYWLNKKPCGKFEDMAC